MPTGPIAPTPTLDGCGGRHILTGPEGRSSPPPREGEFPSPCAPGMRPLVRWGRGRRRPAAALPGSATPLLWQPFPSEPAAARAPLLGSLAPSLSPPSLRCGLGEGLAEAGVRGGDPGPGRGAGRGEGLSPGTIFCLRSGPDRPAAAVLTGPGILLELVLLAQGERRRPRGYSPRPGGGGGPRELTVAAKAAPSAGLEPRGARTGAYTARTESGVRARGSQQSAPTPVPRCRGGCPGSERRRT